MKTFDELIEAGAAEYAELCKAAVPSEHSEGFIAGAKFVSENPILIPAVAELVDVCEKIKSIVLINFKDKDLEGVSWFSELNLALSKLEGAK